MSRLKAIAESTDPLLAEIPRCRICDNPNLEPVIDLGRQAVASLFDDGRGENRFDAPIPLEVVRCQARPGRRSCGFVQLRHTVAPQILYRDYGYRSGINTTMRRHLESLVREIESTLPLRDGDFVVDIGANDGTTLLAYRHPEIVRVGFEPSNVRPNQEHHGLIYIPRVFHRADVDALLPDRRARVVTSIAMFYDVDAPIQFCREVFDLLADDGIWVLEMGYLGAMLEHNSFDAICHEHLGYYSVETLHYVLEESGFELYDLQFNDANGGSMRCWIRKRLAGRTVSDEQRSRVAKALKDERDQGYHDPRRFEQFRKDVEVIRRELMGILERCRREGQRVFGYGASSKGNVLLQYCGIGPHHLVMIADRNPMKAGRLTPGTKIQIGTEAEARAARPDYLLILPWHFLAEFLEREQALRAGGTKFIVPFPQVRIV